MLSNFMSSFKVEEPQQEGKKKLNTRRSKYVSSIIDSNTMELVGLRILPQITNSKNKSNVLIKSSLKMVNKTIPMDFCFLKTCNLCNKQLSPHKDIYMYRGDQGFCSIECRNRQIVLDEMRELESSTKTMVQSYRQCCNEARLETRLILEDLRMQRLKSKV